MSLLHKALKKAEIETEDQEGGPSFIETGGSGRSSSVVVILSVVAALCLIGALGLRFYQKNFVASPATLQPATTPLQLAGGPSAVNLAAEALGLIQTGKYAEAKEALGKVVLLEPRNAEAYNNLGYVLKKLGKNTEAMEQYNKAVQLNPQCVECLNNLGVLYLANHQVNEAQESLQKAVQLKANYADPYLHLAMLYEARGDKSQAKENYQKFLDEAKGVEADFLLKIQQRMSEISKP